MCLKPYLSTSLAQAQLRSPSPHSLFTQSALSLSPTPTLPLTRRRVRGLAAPEAGGDGPIPGTAAAAFLRRWFGLTCDVWIYMRQIFVDLCSSMDFSLIHRSISLLDL